MKKSNTIVTMVLSLGIVTIVAAAILGGVYEMTKEPIAKAEAQAKTDAIANVAPEFNNVPGEEAFAVLLEGDTDSIRVYPAKKDGQLVGAAVESFDDKGFSGMIELMYGFDAEGNVTGFSVLKHAETPGLGAKMGEWFKDPAGNRSVLGKNPAKNNLTVSKDGGEVDAITAATITSRAFLRALDRANKAFIQYRDSQNTNN